jgi:hypothetical protein
MEHPMHIKIFGNDTWDNVVSPALAASGHAEKGFVISEGQKLEALAEQRYPALVSAFKTGFADVENSDLKGFAKMAKVVADIAPKVSELAAELSDLPNLTGFLLGLGQTLWNDAEAAAVQAAASLVTKLA